MTINEQNLANAEMLAATARVSKGGYDYKTYRVPFALPAWPDERQEESAMCATLPDPTWRGAFINRKEVALIVQVLAAIDTRIDDYVEAGTLSGRDADVVGALLERLQGPMPMDPLTGHAAHAHALDESECELLTRIAKAEKWDEVCGWGRVRTRRWASIRQTIANPELTEPEATSR
jgi:hypothetical protein